jgi:hypothetical protein
MAQLISGFVIQRISSPTFTAKSLMNRVTSFAIFTKSESFLPQIFVNRAINFPFSQTMLHFANQSLQVTATVCEISPSDHPSTV